MVLGVKHIVDDVATHLCSVMPQTGDDARVRKGLCGVRSQLCPDIGGEHL